MLGIVGKAASRRVFSARVLSKVDILLFGAAFHGRFLLMFIALGATSEQNIWGEKVEDKLQVFYFFTTPRYLPIGTACGEK